MLDQNAIDLIKKSKKESKILVLKNFCNDTPSWQEFIDYIDKSSYVINDSVPNEYDLSLGAVIKGNVMIKQLFYFYINRSEHIGSTEKIEKELGEDLKSPGGLSSIYINFSSNINNIPSHKDPLDNFYWQCIGSTEWICQEEHYNVLPGDLVYIPANSYHAVNFSMPRAAIGFAYNIA